jgi:hypothetical protein
MEAFLASLPDDRIRREFWLFVHAVFDVVVDYSKASNNYPKKNELFRKLSGNQALKYYQPLFDWFTSEVNIKRTSFDQLLEVYWKDVFKLNY